MYRTCIAVVDATRARLFTFERDNDLGGVRESLSERTDLVNPARRLTPAQLFSDTRMSSNVANGRHYAFDDHRNAHIDHMDGEFARDIAAAIAEAVRDTGARRIIVCASPRMLGTLRETELAKLGVPVDELARDYGKLTKSQIHDYLVDRGLLPESPPRPMRQREA